MVNTAERFLEPALFAGQTVTGDPSENNSSRGLGWEQDGGCRCGQHEASPEPHCDPENCLQESVLNISLPTSHFISISIRGNKACTDLVVYCEQCNKIAYLQESVNELETVSEVFRSSSSSPLLTLSFDLSASHRLTFCRLMWDITSACLPACDIVALDHTPL